MTGVPKSQGCVSCRKQKKRCDLARPACSRCVRLKIACIGAGEKRYKFVEVLATQEQETNDVAVVRLPAAVDPLASVPASEINRITSAFIHRLEMRDVRYDISSYGSFLRQLPRRAHTNEALEAAMDAFSTAFSTPSKEENSVVTMRKYGHALKAIRECLHSPSKAITVETLCAVYLAWSGNSTDELMSHEKGLAILFASVADQGFEGEFETEALIVISVPLLWASMTNDSIQVVPILKRLMAKNRALQRRLDSPDEVEENPVNNSGFATLQLNNMIIVPEFAKEPELHYDAILRTYDLARDDAITLSKKLAEFRATADSPESPRGRLRRDYVAGYGMTAALIVSLNQLLQAFDPQDEELEDESAYYIDRIMELAKEALIFRPLGSGCMAGPLALSLGVTENLVTTMKLRKLTLQYFETFRGGDAEKMATWWHYKFMLLRFRLGNPRPTDDRERAEMEVAKIISFVQCCASHNYIELSFD